MRRLLLSRLEKIEYRDGKYDKKRNFTKVPKVVLEVIRKVITLSQGPVEKIDVYDVVAFLICYLNDANHVVSLRMQGEPKLPQVKPCSCLPRYRFLFSSGVDPG